MNLFGYILSGSVLGADLSSWNQSLLNGSASFTSSAGTELDGYQRLHSLQLYDLFGEYSGMTISQIRDNMKAIYTESFASYSLDDKTLLCKWYVAAPNDRTGITYTPHPDIYHTNGYANQDYAIYNIVRDPLRDNININEVDYKSVRQLTTHLGRDNEIITGRLISVDYYEEYGELEGITGSNKVITVDVNYHMNANNFVDHRWTTRSFYLDDNVTIGTTTYSRKPYTIEEAVAEGEKRRGNIINRLKIDVPGMIAATQPSTSIAQAQVSGGLFFATYKTDFELFITVKSFGCVTDVETASTGSFPWLANYVGPGVTIRDHVSGSLKYE